MVQPTPLRSHSGCPTRWGRRVAQVSSDEANQRRPLLSRIFRKWVMPKRTPRRVRAGAADKGEAT